MVLTAITANAATVDGKWRGESKVYQKKAGGEVTVTTTLNVAVDGSMLKGAMTMSQGRKRSRSLEIRDGKIEGDRVTFTTVAKTKKKGDVSLHWEGVVSGSEIRLSVAGKGSKKLGAGTFVLKKEG